MIRAAEFGVPITIASVSSGLVLGIHTRWILGRRGLDRFLEKGLTEGTPPAAQEFRGLECPGTVPLRRG